jgi:hypothetical protein
VLIECVPQPEIACRNFNLCPIEMVADLLLISTSCWKILHARPRPEFPQAFSERPGQLCEQFSDSFRRATVRQESLLRFQEVLRYDTGGLHDAFLFRANN